MSDGNYNNPGLVDVASQTFGTGIAASVDVADQAFGTGLVTNQPGPGPLTPSQSPATPAPSGLSPSPTVVSETSFNQAPNAGAPGDATYSVGSHSHGTPSDAHLARKLGQVVTVATSGGDFASVAAAVAYVTPLATVTTPWVVSVASGTYAEPPFTIPPFVAVQGTGFAVLQATNMAADFITLAPASLLNYATVVGPTGFGTAALRGSASSTSRTLVSNVIIARGYYGLRVTSGLVECNTLLNLIGGAGFIEFVRVEGGGQCLVTNSTFDGSAGTVAQCFVCTGAGSVLNLTNTIFSCPGATGTMVDDDGSLVLDLVQFITGNIAIHVGSSGVPSMLARATSIREGVGGSFTTTLRVDTAAAVIHFYGAMARNKFVLATGTQLEASFQDVTTGDGGSTVIGDTFTARSANPNVVLSTSQYQLATNWTGLAGTGDGGVTRAGGLVLAVAAGHGFINNGVDMFRVDWVAQTITLDPGSTEYVYVDQLGILRKSVVHPDYSLSIVLAQAVTNATDVVLLTRDEITVSHTLSRTQEYFEDVIGPINLGGGATTVNGSNPLGLDVDPGTFSVGLSERVIAGGAGVTFTLWYQSSPGNWVAVPGQTSVDTARYNDVSSGLVALTGTNWKKDLLYVVSNAGGDEYHVVYGQEQFATQIAAEQGNYPAPPYILEHYAMRSGGVASLRNAAGIGSTTDARPHIGGYISTAGVTDHGALTGLGADDHLQYLNTVRAAAWHFSTPVAGEAHVKNGNLHTHGAGGDGGQVNHTTLSNVGVYTHAQLDSHVNDTSNPHATTAAQVGAPPTSRTVASGNGLAGGGDLSANRTLSVQAADATVAVGAGGVAVGTITDGNVAAANKDGLAATPSMRTLGAGAQQACAGSDARLSNSRAPTGAAGGSLAGTYPNPSIAALAVTDTEVAAANKDGLAATPSMRTLGTGAQQACAGSDSRLSNSRAPTGAAGGSLAGTYPNPSIAALAVTDTEVAAANKDGLAATPSMRTLGTGAQQACAGSDSRLSNSRAPTGAAGGSLAGTYPNPSIAALAVTNTEVAAANKDGLAATPSMRTLGTSAQQACAGNDARLSDARLPLNYQSTQDAARTTTSSTTYPGATKLTLTTPALTGTFQVSWSAVVDYSATNRDLSIRVQNTTDAATLEEMIFRPVNAAVRQPFSGLAIVTLAGAAKTFAVQFHGANAGDTAGCAAAYLTFQKVG